MALARGNERLAYRATTGEIPMLAIPLDRLAFIIVKAREFDAEVPVEPDAASGSDGPDDDERQVLLDTPDNPTEEELRDAIDGLGVPERQDCSR